MVNELDRLMRFAIDTASSGSTQDLPIGAVVFDQRGSVIAEAKNSCMENDDPIAHAELLVLQKIGMTHLKREGRGFTIAVTLEPCPMCAWAIRAGGVGRLVFGAWNSTYGSAGSVFDLLRDHRFGRGVEVIGGVLKNECEELLRETFLGIRNNRGR